MFEFWLVYSGERFRASWASCSRRAVVSYWPKYVQEVLVNCLRGLSLPRKSVVTGRLTDRPDMTLDVYCGRNITIQEQQSKHIHDLIRFKESQIKI